MRENKKQRRILGKNTITLKITPDHPGVIENRIIIKNVSIIQNFMSTDHPDHPISYKPVNTCAKVVTRHGEIGHGRQWFASLKGGW